MFDRVKSLAEKRKKSLNEVENDVGFAKNTLYKWKTQKPNSDKLEKIADYFNVTTDYLLGREVAEENFTPKAKFIARGFEKLNPNEQDLLEKMLKTMSERDDVD